MKINLREAEIEDCRFIWELRNSDTGKRSSINQKYIPYKHHKNWYNNNKDFYRIILDKNKRIGFLRKDSNDYISIHLIEEYRNKGIGTKILDKENGKAIILFNNVQSIKSFVKSGFKLKGFYLDKLIGDLENDK